MDTRDIPICPGVRERIAYARADEEGDTNLWILGGVLFTEELGETGEIIVVEPACGMIEESRGGSRGDGDMERCVGARGRRGSDMRRGDGLF